MKTFGLTGGVAAGKSTARKIFEEEGVPVLDADQIARELSQPGGEAFPLIQQRFGTTDRTELRRIIFSDPQARQDLEGLLHPLIQKESRRRIESFRSQGRDLVIYEAALLVETGRFRDFDGLILVEAPIELRKQRLISRDAATSGLADRILTAQSTDDVKRKVATHILDNSGTPEALRDQIKRLIPLLRD